MSSTRIETTTGEGELAETDTLGRP
jgi:hypothetical protein